jgi:protein-S-isoprenylcysteine O-methyltransferase Ste14
VRRAASALRDYSARPMSYQWVLRALALFMIMRAAATIYFFVFWRWFEMWRRHRTAALVMMVGTFAVIGVATVMSRDVLLATRLALPVPLQAIGWAIIIVAGVLGADADRQIGPRVRYFKPFFEGGRIELRTTGAFGIVRHPIYASWILFQLGAFLVTGYVAVVFACAVLALGALWFTRQEEKRIIALLEDPTAYDRYRQRVPALFPRLRRGQ